MGTMSSLEWADQKGQCQAHGEAAAVEAERTQRHVSGNWAGGAHLLQGRLNMALLGGEVIGIAGWHHC